MNRIKRIILSTMVALGVMAPALVPAVAHAGDANIQGNLNCGADLQFQVGGDGCPIDKGGTTELNTIITLIINIISVVVGIVAVIMIIVGGFKYITSNGDSGAVTSAKNTILYAIVGLVIVALAQIIVRFVLGNLSEVAEGGGGGGGGGGAVDGGAAAGGSVPL